MNRRHVVIGSQFGRWTVLHQAASRKSPSGSYFVYWRCRCECGAEVEVRQRHLLSGRSLSCGCWKREAAAQQKTTHGGSHSALYDVWTQMLQRCENERNKSFRRYGARGVEVCAEWHEFRVFQAWALANGYAPDLTIDREDNDASYCPGNCRWVPNVVNCRNNSITLRVEWEGREVALSELAEEHGVKAGTAYSRYRLKGWTLRQALGIDPAPRVARAPYSAETRQRMREAALLREQRKRESVLIAHWARKVRA